MSEFKCRSAFCVINNPRYDITYKHNEEGEIVRERQGGYIKARAYGVSFIDRTTDM